MTAKKVTILFSVIASLMQTPANAQDQHEINIQQVQLDLQRLGYSVGAADGIFGDTTQAAIEAFQARIGSSVTGEISAELALVLQHYYVGAVDVPNGALVFGVRPGKFSIATWLDGREQYNEDIPILECVDGRTVLTDVGVSCVTD